METARQIRPIAEHRLYCEGGVALAELCLELPQTDGMHPKIAAYYTALSDASHRFCEKELFPRVRQAYLDDPDPRKRFSVRRAVLRVRCTARDEGAYLSVRREVRLSLRGAAVTKIGGEVFSRQDGRLLPLSHFLPARVRRRLRRKKQLPKKRDIRGFLFTQSKVCILTDSDEVLLDTCAGS